MKLLYCYKKVMELLKNRSIITREEVCVMAKTGLSCKNFLLSQRMIDKQNYDKLDNSIY